MKLFNRLSLVHQFVAASVALSVLILLALVLHVSVTSYSSSVARMEDGLQGETHGTRQLLDNAYQISIGLTDRVAGILTDAFPGGFTVAPDERVATGTVEAPALRSQGVLLNADFRAVDAFARSTGGVATLFVREGDDFVRVSTSLKTQGGERAIGTRLAHDHPAYGKVLAGETYLGPAELFGRHYLTKYLPQRDASGKVVAILFVGFDLADVFASLRKALAEARNGDESFVAYTGGGRRGELMFHPRAEGGKLLEQDVDGAGRAAFAPLLEKSEGRLRYPAAGGERIAAWEQSDSWGGVVVARTGEVAFYTRASTQLRNGILIAGLLAAVVLSALLWLFFARQLRPVGKVVERIERMGRGDFSGGDERDETLGTRNELELIRASVARTAHHVGGLIADLRRNASALSESASAIAHSSASAAEVAGTQSEAAQAMASGVEQMSASIMQVRDSSQEARDLASSVLDQAGHGRSQAVDALAQMTRIESAVHGASGHIGRLDDQAQRISSVVSIIKEVAEQTNLLALNAAIEAARAGEQGRGFAVVADEVRKLAERTSASTREITDMIESIQGGAREAAVGMQTAVGLVADGVTAVERARGLIGDIEGGAQSIARATADIASALEEQSAASNAIGSEVDQIAQLSERTTDSAQASSSVATQLESLSSRMDEAVARFRTD
ncbi:MAG: methyl-accepting chemotaxis protein [Candidatus Dactylopiibacterium sp.]|nr:methyl-accepting chemotaxis protein [Candidatus Dactylopiibacterium sp.]